MNTQTFQEEVRNELEVALSESTRAFEDAKKKQKDEDEEPCAATEDAEMYEQGVGAPQINEADEYHHESNQIPEHKDETMSGQQLENDGEYEEEKKGDPHNDATMEREAPTGQSQAQQARDNEWDSLEQFEKDLRIQIRANRDWKEEGFAQVNEALVDVNGARRRQNEQQKVSEEELQIYRATLANL